MAPSSSQVSGSTKKQLVPTRFVAYAKASRRTIEALFAAMFSSVSRKKRCARSERTLMSICSSPNVHQTFSVVPSANSASM